MEGPFDQPTRQFPAEHYFPGRKMFAGRFVLERRIGRGGMGEVWLASDNELGRDVALKFAPAEVANDPKSIAELRREVIAGLELSHPRIARVHDLQVGDGEVAISMECVKGKSLSDLQAETPHGFFEPEEIAGWIDDVKDALKYAHTEAQRTHRDVKPKNILVDAKTGHAKLVDFGISKRLSDSMTRNTGKDSSGSLAYMSPQQMMGERNSAEDDWYSLGATVYELLTGAPPFFRGDVRTQIERVVPPPMGERRKELVGEMIDAVGDPIPQDWEDWVARMLSKDRGRMEEDVRAVVAPPLPGAAVASPPPLPKEAPPELPVVPKVEICEDLLETGIWGDAPKMAKAKPERPKPMARDLQPMNGAQGLAWAGVMALLYGVGHLALIPARAMADEMGQALRLSGMELTVLAFLGLGVWWRFRRHGKSALHLALIFLAVGAVCAVGRDLSWSFLVKEASGSKVRLLVMVYSFLFPLTVAVSLMVGMAWTFKTWVFRLMLAGLAGGVVSILIEWFFREYGSAWPQVFLVAGPLFVGAIFGVVSALSMVRSRKVLV